MQKRKALSWLPPTASRKENARTEETDMTMCGSSCTYAAVSKDAGAAGSVLEHESIPRGTMSQR